MSVKIYPYKEVKEYNETEAQQYANERGKPTRFYINVIGWSHYFTLKKTLSVATAKGWRQIRVFYPLVIILVCLFTTSCASQKNGCGSYSRWENRHSFNK